MDLPPPIAFIALPDYEGILSKLDAVNPDITLSGITAMLREIKRLPKHDQETKENNVEHTYELLTHAINYRNEFYPNDPVIDELKAIKFAIVHDWVEILVGDKVTLGISGEDYNRKQELEKHATEALVKFLRENRLRHFADLLEEYERQDTKTARFVKAVDKLTPPLKSMVGDALTPFLDHGLLNETAIRDAQNGDQNRFKETFGDEFPELAMRRRDLAENQLLKSISQAEGGYYMI